MSIIGEQRETGGLEPYRRRLDSLDEQIVGVLGERFEICREIALYKREHEIAMMQPGRVEEVRARYLARGADAGLPSPFTGDFFELLIAATCRMEDELIDAEPELVAGEPEPIDGEPRLIGGEPARTSAGAAEAG
jgi:4-amino-4-deoxychorismate mutase